jgi:hypothetical protein
MKFPRELSRPAHRPRQNFSVAERKAPRRYTAVSERIRGDLGQQIYDFRKFGGLTRVALAKKMFVSETSIFFWESGEFEPSRIAWASFSRVRQNYRRKMKKMGKDLDGGPLIGRKAVKVDILRGGTANRIPLSHTPSL